MKNPLEMWNGLSRNGKIAVVVAVIGISVLLYYERKKKAAAAAAAGTDQSGQSTDTSTGATTTDTTPTDTTGGQFEDPSLDPTLGGGSYGSSGGMSTYPMYGSDLDPSLSPSLAGSTSGAGVGAPDVNGSGPEAQSGPIIGPLVTVTGGGAPARPHPAHAHGAHGKPGGKGATTKTHHAGAKAPTHTKAPHKPATHHKTPKKPKPYHRRGP